MFAPVPTNPSERVVRKFGWAMLGGFVFLAALMLFVDWYRHPAGPWAWNGGRRQWAAVVLGTLGVLLFGVSLVGGRAGTTVYRIWMRAARRVGIIVSTIALTVFYFVLLPPFVLLVRRQDPLRRRLHRGGTYWEEYPSAEPTLDRLRRLF